MSFIKNLPNTNAALPPVERGLDPVSYHPLSISLTIFSYLSPNELGRIRRVSKQWGRLASMLSLWNALDLRKLSPSLKVFEESDWKTHVDLSSFGLDVSDAPPLDKRQAIPFLKRCIYSLSIEENAGVTLLTIPKGLTFKKLVKLAGSFKGENRPRFRYIWDRISSEIRDIPVDKTYRLVITNNVFKNSRNLSTSDQEALVKERGCEIPSLLEAATLLVVTYMSTQQRLYNDKPWTYTRCSERGDRYQLVVGGFTLGGLSVGKCNYAGEGCGVGGSLRKF
ncbi:MAG: F-box protein [Chlamydiales bacterium]|nr:F-box protein [Chlamydiales bacterium]